MPVVQPPKPRYRIEEMPDGFKIVIPSSKHWLGTPILGIYLFVLWVMVIGVITSSLGEQPNAGASPDLFGQLILAGLGLLAVVVALFLTYLFLANLFGQEVVLVRPQSISTRRGLFMFGRWHEYLREHIRALRVQVPTTLHTAPRAMSSIWGFVSKGSVAFDYGARTFSFIHDADEAEAKQILNLIWQRFPQYRNP